MAANRLCNLLKNGKHLLIINERRPFQLRNGTTTATGAILPEPPRTSFGLLGIVCTVIPGLLIGATISKNIASFLEENDLFVPSDDDDDDD